jgi:hypothetical protein
MHRTHPDGRLIDSACDFCRRTWDPEGSEIMIEGHQGSLICLKCLSAAYRYLSIEKGGEENQGKACTLCLEDRDQPEWESPIDPDKRACLRCIKQAATALEKDPETGWKRPQ